MKRLLCILSSMNTGGAETFLMKIYRRLDKSKYQMDFCVNKEENYYSEEIEKMGGKIYCIPSKSENVNQFKKQLGNIVYENKYDYVMRITSSAMGFMDLKIAKKAGAKVCVARSSNASDGGGLKARIVHFLGRLLYQKYADVKIAPSDLAGKYTFGKRIYNKGGVNILHNAVDLNIFRYNVEGREKIRKEFGIDESIKIIGHVGRFMEQKNHKFLIEVFSKLKKENLDTVLMLVGTGYLENQIREQISALNLEDSIIFTGVRSDIPRILSAMDVFLFPSLYEGMPNTVIEAQACGLPCIISDSITKEADITGLVKYVSLEHSANFWKDEIIRKLNTPRCDQRKSFEEHRYDIDSAVNDFIKYIFGE